jgi:hypothetical protein
MLTTTDDDIGFKVIDISASHDCYNFDLMSSISESIFGVSLTS